MSLSSPHCLEHHEFELGALMAEHPPRFTHAHKQAVFATMQGTPSTGELRCSRWRSRELPERLAPDLPKVELCAGVFDYQSSSSSAWHVNFADPQLFVAYGSGLLAQDELQVLEHPALGSLREALLAARLPAVTEEGNAATPVLITGVPRRFALDTSHLYGNRFAAAPFAEVRAALTVLDPPTTTNILTMAAPVGRGRYRRDQLEKVLTCAFSGFSAARDLSTGPVEVHTGFWGCGAFGGNRVVMVALQLLAARLAGVGKIIFHAVNRDGVWDAEAGVEALRKSLAGPDTQVGAILDRFTARGDRWGESDGN
jgi:hypothetical protein